MASFEKKKLSNSTDGRGILVAATSTPGTLLHTGSSDITEKDEVFVYLTNTSVTAVKCTVEFGGVTTPNDLIEVTILPEDGLKLVIPGSLIIGNASPLLVAVFAATGSVVVAHGWTHRIS